jgi:predicted nuclease of restriction endonuclease-like (RecB) superfamily
MSLLPDNYISILARLKEQIQKARMKAAFSANAALLQLYWDIGSAIIELQQAEGWGAKVIDRLSSDLKADFPEFKGLSVRNLKYMVKFAKILPAFGQQAAAQSQSAENQPTIFVQVPAAQLPWGHLQVLMDKVTETNEFHFYAEKCLENGWSRNILVEQINSGLFNRQGTAITNFSHTLPSIQSDLAQQTLKNPYLFDFLSLGEEARERDLENALIQHLKHFMLELGRGFAYVGRQKNLVVQGDDYFLDLLFYNYNLHCFVVFELKVGDFKPEYAGKLNFYVNAVNQQIKGIDDKPSIGVMLCKTPNETVVRYSLQGIESPIGVAEYQLANALPKQFTGEIPTVEELEAEIDQEYEELKTPTEKKWDTIKQKLASLSQPKVEVPISHKRLCLIYDHSLYPLFEYLLEKLKSFHPDFMSHNYFWTGPQNISDLAMLGNSWKDDNFLKQNHELYFFYRLNGLKPLGIDTFDIYFQLNYMIDQPYWWGFSIPFFNQNQPILRKLYNEQLTSDDMGHIWNIIHSYIVDEIEKRMSSLDQKKLNGQ